jgi:hypothetical protein
MLTQILIIKKIPTQIKKKKKSYHQTHMSTQFKLVSLMIIIFFFFLFEKITF